MRHLNKKNQEIFLILKILLRDGGQKGFLYGKNSRFVSLFLMDLINSIDIDKRVLFVSPKSGDIYRQILEKLGKSNDNLTLEQFLIEFYKIKDKVGKKIFVVVENAEELDQTDVINLLRIFGKEKDLSIIFSGSDRLGSIINSIKTKKVFSDVNFVFRLDGESKNIHRILAGLVVFSVLSGFLLFYMKNEGRDEEKKVQIVKKDLQIIKSLEEKVVENKNVKKNSVKEDVCDFLCLFERSIYLAVKSENIPDIEHEKPVVKEKYRIYAGAFRNIKNAKILIDKIFKMTDLKAEIEERGGMKNVYIKAYTKEEALEIRDRLNEIGIKPYIKRLEK